jgi:hypothetical protein
MNTEIKLNGFWVKLAGGIMLAGILAIISLSYSLVTKIAVIQTDVTYVREALKNYDIRIAYLESSTLNSKDAEQLKTWTELKLEAIKIQIEQYKNKKEM